MKGWVDQYTDGGGKKKKLEPPVEEQRTVTYTDKGLYDKAAKAESDSLAAYNLTKHDAKYDQYNQLKMILGKDLERPEWHEKNSRAFESYSTPDSKETVYTSKKKPHLTYDFDREDLDKFLKNTKLKPERYKNVTKSDWSLTDLMPTNVESTKVVPTKTDFIEDDLDRASIKKKFPKATDAFINQKIEAYRKNPGYFKGNVTETNNRYIPDNAIYTSETPPKGYSKAESVYEAISTSTNTSIPYWKKPVIHNVYQEPPVPTKVDTSVLPKAQVAPVVAAPVAEVAPITPTTQIATAPTSPTGVHYRSYAEGLAALKAKAGKKGVGPTYPVRGVNYTSKPVEKKSGGWLDNLD